MTDSTNPTIILGGGFTGLFTALHLSHHHYSQPTILIEQKERFTFNPLLYEFLSGEMSDRQVCPTYEELLDGSNITFVQDTVEAIDLSQHQIGVASGKTYPYQYLVLALGCITGYFGIEGAKEHSFPFRTRQQALSLANHLRQCLHQATQTADPGDRHSLLTITIVGAGPSGVELAATLADLLPNWYGELGGDPQEVHIVLMDRETELLAGGAKGSFKTELEDTAKTALEQHNTPVELRLGATVTAIHPDRVEYQHGDRADSLPTATVVWTAGSANHPLIENLPIPPEKRGKHGRLLVKPTMQLLDFPEVFAGGDCAATVEEPQSPTAQVAYQQGGAIAHNLKALVEGRELSSAEVHLRGTLLKLGLGESAAHLFNRFEIKGKTGHLIRQTTYLELLPTPAHNFKATTQWLIDEIFQKYSSPGNLKETVAVAMQ